MCLRAKAGEVDESDCHWWTQIQTMSEQEQRKMVDTNKQRKQKIKQ